MRPPFRCWQLGCSVFGIHMLRAVAGICYPFHLAPHYPSVGQIVSGVNNCQHETLSVSLLVPFQYDYESMFIVQQEILETVML